MFWEQESILFIDYFPNGQIINAEYYSSLLVELKDILKEKKAVESSPRWSCSCATTALLAGHLQPRRNWPTWVSSVMITHHIPRIWPRQITICSPDSKTIEISPFSPDVEVIAVAETWLDEQASELF